MADTQFTSIQESDQAPSADYAQQIVNAVSHDLKNPTRQIKSFLQILQSHSGSELDDKGRHYLDLVLQAADTMQVKLDALTLLSRASTADLQFEPCDVSAIVDDAVNRLTAQIADSKAVVAVDVNVDGKVSADHNQMVSVFLQLIGNSLKFCEEPATIKIAGEVKDSKCVLTVSDSGPGFEARDSATAFDLFRRFHLADHDGTGTGLTVVRTLLGRHGSTPTIESSPDSGTTVRFSLPLA